MLSDLIGDQSHFIPSYTGHCPQSKFSVGLRYGATTHRTITDPRYAHIYSRHWSGTDATPPKKCDFNDIVDAVNERAARNGDVIYRHPMVSTYSGHLPRRFTNETSQLGQRFTRAASQGIRDFYENIVVGRRIVPEVKRTLHRTIETNFKSTGEPPSFQKLGYAGHHPLQFDHFGATNMIVSTKSQKEFRRKLADDNIRRCSPITTTLMENGVGSRV